jgi:hypothetical protein
MANPNIQSVEMGLWKAAYVAAVSNGENHVSCMETADAALEHFREAFDIRNEPKPEFAEVVHAAQAAITDTAEMALDVGDIRAEYSWEARRDDWAGRQARELYWEANIGGASAEDDISNGRGHFPRDRNGNNREVIRWLFQFRGYNIYASSRIPEPVVTEIERRLSR